MNKPFPIVLIAYNRPNHTYKVLASLQNNELANESTLYIYIDGLKQGANEIEIAKHNEVIAVAQKTKWCAEVIIHISEQNRGCRFGPIFGINEVLKNHEAVIILEDDIVTSTYFLQFMNESLNYYKNYQSVFSISGFNLPEKRIPIPKDYEYDVYVSLRQQNWGWGTWANRWQQVNWNKDYITGFLTNQQQVEAFNRGGDDLSKMLKEEFDGKSQAWDIQFSFAQFFYHAVSIIPCRSYTQNIGLDNSGTHTIDQSDAQLNSDISKAPKNARLLPVIYQDKRFINAFYNNYTYTKRPIWQKIINRISRLFGGKNVFVIKKKIYA
jgi:GR25 family glycosyltransferase involved in LPS biosynthesis